MRKNYKITDKENNDIYKWYSMYCKNYAERTVDCEMDTSTGFLIATLDDGSHVEFDVCDKRTRYIPNDYADSLDDEQYKNEFGYKLRYIMRCRCISREKLSEMTGISYGQISKYINGKAEPSIYKVMKIARALDCSLDDLWIHY